MSFSLSHFPLLFLWIAFVAGEANLLSYVDGSIGNVLGSFFGLPGTNATFDYVIVGGGTAGLTLATRLASDPTVSVAVIEAGGFYEVDNGNRSVVPGYSNFYTGSDPKNYQPLIDWGFSTVPQPGGANRTIHYARGRTLGGSSARHYMIYHRPSKGTMDKWADEVGDESYKWDNFFPFFKKSANYTAFNRALYNATIQDQDPSWFDPQAGPLHVSFSNYADAFGSWAQKGFTGVGMQNTNGLNGGNLIGSAYSTLSIDPRNGYRSSSESSFLQAALQNGTAPVIYKNTMAMKLLFDDGKTATGVSVRTAGPYGIPPLNYTLSAKKEVIVCAGVFQSPQLLMVSGVGPQQTLQEKNIPVVKNAPGVGQNMWDHILYGISWKVNVLTASNSLNHPEAAAALADQFKKNGSGSLSAFGAGYYGWEKLPQPYRSTLSNASTAALAAHFPDDWPELEWLPISAYLGYQRNRQTEDPKDGANYATINPGIIAPLSRGNVTISSSDMTDPPVLDPAWLTDPTDQAVAVQAFKRTREIWSVLEKGGLTVGEEYLPGSNVTSDEDILDFIQRSFMTIYHAAGTCKMGKQDDNMAVIDSKAKVYGVQNLRVVDASSFPFLPPGHPQSSVYALAEKIAEDIMGPGTPPPGYSLGGYVQDQSLVQAKVNSSKPAQPSSSGAPSGAAPRAVLASIALAGVMAWTTYL